jgi:glycerate kinase
MKVLAAPNAFKESLSSPEAARSIALGLKEGHPYIEVIEFPIGDGGDGTLEALSRVLPIELKRAFTLDPLSRRIAATFGLFTDGTKAYIEMAEASGLRRLKPSERNPLHATSLGTGILIESAVNEGVQEILLGTGGSATTDGGIGALAMLGIKFSNERGERVEPFSLNLSEISSVTIEPHPKRLEDVRITILVDVLNPLLGPDGAARVYGPQKGASPEDVATLERGLESFARVVYEATGRDIGLIEGGGAAGGLPAGFHGLLGANIRNGAEAFLDLVEFDRALGGVDLVITGEGRLDDQSLFGKAPVAAARRARSRDIPAIALVGSFEVDSADPFQEEGIQEVIVIGKRGDSIEESMRHTSRDLRETAREIGIRLKEKD